VKDINNLPKLYVFPLMSEMLIDIRISEHLGNRRFP